jgi:plasmid stabilization system protein ParE
MAFEIVWTAEADNDFRQIVKYLKEEWSQQVAEKFILRTYIANWNG